MSPGGDRLGPADDHAVAARIATDAGRLLLGIRSENAGADPAVLRKAGDEGAQEFIAEALRRARPDDSVLSEEAADDLGRLAAERVWIVDPLDGTREYSEEGRGDWAVHVALWSSGRLVAGAVALPARGITLSTADPPVLPAAAAGPLRFIVSRTRASAEVLAVAARLGAVTVAMGSAGAKAMAVVLGDVEAYLHTGGQYEWDSAAPVAVAAAAGLHTSRIDGSPLVYNRENPYLPDLLICRPDLADDVLAAVTAVANQAAVSAQ